MAEQRRISLVGAAWGMGGADRRCAEAPFFLRSHGLVRQLERLGVVSHWHSILALGQVDESGNRIPALVEFAHALAGEIACLVERHQFFSVIGGDHSCALGTWTGAAKALASSGPLGLIWIDAHMDSHVPETSPSGKLHGMPLAFLLGQYPEEMSELFGPEPILLPEYTCLIGARSFEAAEPALLSSLGVRVFTMPEIERAGLSCIIKQAVELVSDGTAGFGVSIDLDAVDPADAPAVETPVEGGLSARELESSLRELGSQRRWVGMELAEFNPALDIGQRTAALIPRLIAAAANRGGGI